jgi:hypothetical protein
MFTPRKNPRLLVAIVFGGALIGVTLYGCTSAPNGPATRGSAPIVQTDSPTTQPTFAFFGTPPQKSGNQLWAENCGRCHNIRPPETFSDAQWAVVVHHMRLRANLTGDEADAILKFLQASN